MKIGFIGTGNMGSAMMGGMVSSGIVAASNVMASDIFQAALDRISDQLNIATSTNNRDVVDFADISEQFEITNQAYLRELNDEYA